MQFIISCTFQILADYDNIFILVSWLIVLELYDIMRYHRYAVDKVNFENEQF